MLRSGRRHTPDPDFGGDHQQLEDTSHSVAIDYLVFLIVDHAGDANALDRQSGVTAL